MTRIVAGDANGIMLPRYVENDSVADELDDPGKRETLGFIVRASVAIAAAPSTFVIGFDAHAASGRYKLNSKYVGHLPEDVVRLLEQVVISDYKDRTQNSNRERRDEPHNGLDFKGRNRKDYILAVSDGIVVNSNSNNTGGNVITIGYDALSAVGDYVVTYQAHNYKNLVKRGDAVKRGQRIAILGKTGGRRLYPHLHFGVAVGKLTNPDLEGLEKWTKKRYILPWKFANPHLFWIPDAKELCYRPGIEYPSSPLRFTLPIECKSLAL